MSYKSFKQKQKEETLKEVERLKKIGCIQVSFDTLKEILKSKYSLKLDKNSFLKYYNTSNEFSALELTHTPIDETNQGWCNTNSNWYKRHCKNKTEKYYNWQTERNEYFCLKDGHIMFLG